MVLGFQKRAVPGINGLSKIHTIRVDKHKRWKAGTVIHFATGVRTKKYNCFLIGKCQSVQEIQMYFSESGLNDSILVDNYVLVENEMEWLAFSDGFVDYDEFRNWFIETYGMTFKGRIIHWTNKRY